MRGGESSGAGLIGAPAPKHDGAEFLTGRIRYTADLSVPGMCHAAVVRSPHAHARLRAVDTSAALRHRGVHGGLTGAQAVDLVDEVPHSLDPAHLGGNHAEIRVLALDKVVYAGQPVAAVVADSEAEARAAASQVKVDYELLPAVLDAEEALRADAPRLYERWDSNLIIGGAFGQDNFDQVAGASQRTLSGELRAHRSNAAPMEPRAFLASWDENSQRLTLWGTTQNPHPLRVTLSRALGLRESQVRVVAAPLGGSFGLKMYGGTEEFLICTLSRLVGRPVRWVEDRAASLLPGSGEQIMRYRLAFEDSARVIAVDVDVISNHGAAASGHGWGMAFVGAMATGCGYALEHCHVSYRVVATNKAPWGGTKPFGKDSATLIMEHMLDRVAEATGVDPAEVRRRNFVPAERFPHTHTSGLELDSGNYEGALELVMARLGYTELRSEQARLRADGRYLGVGLGFELMPENADIPGALVAAFDTSTVRMDATGQAQVLTGVTSPGSGSDTGIAQLVAHELGVRLADVRVEQGDTDVGPFGYGNLSSRSIVTGGSSAVLAARDVAAKLRIVAAHMLGAEPGEIVLGDGVARVAGGSERPLAIGAVAEAVFSLGYLVALDIEPHLESTRTFRPANIRQTPDALGRLNTYSTFPYAIHASVIELDPETGLLDLRRHVVAHDCGTIVNPLMVDGQLVGGAVMGLSRALGEEFLYDADGAPGSTGLKTYLLARAADLPTIELEHQVTPTPVTPTGAKGVGEAGFAGAQAALLDAVNDAMRPLGARLDQLPASPVNILRALRSVAHRDPGDL